MSGRIRRSVCAIAVGVIVAVLTPVVTPAAAPTGFGDPPPIGTDPTTRAIGLQVYVRGERVISRPTTTNQPPCVYPCASGTFQEAHAAKGTVSVGGVDALPPRVDVTALTVTAHWHNCYYNFDGSISCFKDIKLASASALVRSAEIYIHDGGVGVVRQLSIGGAYSHCETEPYHPWDGEYGRTTARTSIGSLRLEGGEWGGVLPDDLTAIPPNLVISLGFGTLVLNEQSPSPPSADVPIAVNALHLYMPDREVIVAHASCTR